MNTTEIINNKDTPLYVLACFTVIVLESHNGLILCEVTSTCDVNFVSSNVTVGTVEGLWTGFILMTPTFLWAALTFISIIIAMMV